MGYQDVQQYKEQAIKSMTNSDLIVLLFDEAIKNINYSVVVIEQEKLGMLDKYLDKSKSIFSYLSMILDRKVEISNQLYNMYSFFYQEIVKAQIKRDCTPLKEILPLVLDMRETWVSAGKLVHKQLG